MMSSWDLGQPKVEELPETSFPKQRLKVEELPETQIITSDANELHSAIHCLISCGEALHAARKKLQAHVEYPKKLDLFRKFFWMLCSVTTWNDKKDELLSDVRHLSEEILSVMTVENLNTIASRVNSDGCCVINVANIFKVSSPPNGVQNHEIWVDSKFVEEALQKIPQ